jgi:outer membrane protein assembly factor BamB
VDAQELVCPDGMFYVDEFCPEGPSKVCAAEAEYWQFVMEDCSKYFGQCCSGGVCAKLGPFACPPGQICLASGDLGEAECTLPPVCPPGEPGQVLFTFQADGEIRSTPAVGADGTIYFGTMEATLVALGCDGEQKWTWKYPCEVPDACPQAFEGAVALGNDGAIYVADDIVVPNYAFALGPEGDQLWTWETMMVYGSMDASPAVDQDGTIWVAGHGVSGYVGPLGQVTALDMTGKPLAGFPLPTGAIVASPVLYGGILYAAESLAAGAVIAVSSGAAKIWESHVQEVAAQFAPSSLAIDGDGKILVAHGVTPGGQEEPYLLLSRLDPADGKVIWQMGVADCPYGPVGSPVVSKAPFGMHVAVATSDGRVYLANPLSGGVQYQVALESPALGEEIVSGAPVFGDDGRLYAAYASGTWDSHVPAIAAVDVSTGKTEVFAFDGLVGDRITTSLQMGGGGVILFGTKSGKLVAWQSPAGGPDPLAPWPSFRHDLRNTGNGGKPCVPCEASCSGKQCGPDGCGGICGVCGDWLYCMGNKCVNGDPPQCDGKQCGADGMGGICGECSDGWKCTAMGKCEPMQSGCDALPAGGLCMSGWLVACSGGKLVYEKCPFGKCMVDVATGQAACAEVPCLPACFGKTCGGDECGGSCGTCAPGYVCDEVGVCRPEEGCGGIGSTGLCIGQVLAACKNGKLVLDACLEQGLICGPEGCDGPPTCRPVWPEYFPCDTLPKYGHCAGGHYFHCHDGLLDVSHCSEMGPVGCLRVDLDKLGCAPY